MATYTPPPYFPQGSLAPPDKNRYKKFKLMIVAIVIFVVLLVGGIGWGVWHLIKAAF
jgi:nitrate reductase NapE component